MTQSQSVEVWASWQPPAEPARAGVLGAVRVRGEEVFSFRYDEAWLRSANALALDPRLDLYAGAQYPPSGRENFGVFLDSAPDRWGRVLMDRREGLRARTEGRKPRSLGEMDYLLGVYDGHRLGALRYRRSGELPFLDDDAALASPPWTKLRELQAASVKLEAADAEDDPQYAKWLGLLIAPGRSLGGARPKASVIDAKGALWIAKFPSTNDVEDVGAWEAVAHALAKRAGVETAPWRTEKFRGPHHTFLSRRFDRGPSGTRIHFASAMTMLERADGEVGASYLDLAEVLVQRGASTSADLEQLWRRMAFFVCISNVDDHLRNHGFLLTPHGWRLAPAYDLNPVAGADGLTLNISETDNAQDPDLLLSVAEYFRLRPKAAEKILASVRRSVSAWAEEAEKLGLSRDARRRMAPAFRVAEK